MLWGLQSSLTPNKPRSDDKSGEIACGRCKDRLIERLLCTEYKEGKSGVGDFEDKILCVCYFYWSKIWVQLRVLQLNSNKYCNISTLMKDAWIHRKLSLLLLTNCLKQKLDSLVAWNCIIFHKNCPFLAIRIIRIFPILLKVVNTLPISEISLQLCNFSFFTKVNLTQTQTQYWAMTYMRWVQNSTSTLNTTSTHQNQPHQSNTHLVNKSNIKTLLFFLVNLHCIADYVTTITWSNTMTKSTGYQTSMALDLLVRKDIGEKFHTVCLR